MIGRGLGLLAARLADGAVPDEVVASLPATYRPMTMASGNRASRARTRKDGADLR